MFGTRRPPGSGDSQTPGGPSPSGGEPGRTDGPGHPSGYPPGHPPATSRRSEPPRSAEPPRRGGYALPGTRPRDPGKSGETPVAAERQLVVGREISLSGEIKACEKLVVEGQVKADLKDCKVLYITSSGLYEGAAVVDTADISGRFDGDLTVKETLMLRASGRVSGTLRYAELEIERGGRVAGTLEDIPAPAAAKPAAKAKDDLVARARAPGASKT
ncbi:MAG: polymer-forming cytoskeletal protein [Rhodospirillales bacterium]|nr:polymer-forming cytoskeletal protein [Rhodospirillales bacterium]